MKADFSGYATKSGIRCADGRIIHADAFVKNDGDKVPLVWQHTHNDPENVLGHAVLEQREDGVYAHGFFNQSARAQSARESVRHGDITQMSIYANKLVEKDRHVLHGSIREVSLVLSGANPGAKIENVNLQHGDGYLETLDDEVIITSGHDLSHADNSESENTVTSPAPTNQTEDNEDETVQDVLDTFNEKQLQVLHHLVGEAIAGEAEEDSDEDDSDDNEDDNLAQSDIDSGDQFITHKENFEMTRNLFEMYNGETKQEAAPSLTHDDMKAIVDSAQRGGSLKRAFEDYALEHSIENIEVLFPDAKTVGDTPQHLARRTEWVSRVINGVRKSPFARIKTVYADLTPEEARAKGYVKGSMKKEEVVALLKRKTDPTTIYKKQKIDRDDIIDITDIDVVAWIKGEMRIMLDEEIATAILLGDGRSVADDDHIPHENIRPIAYDHDFYAHRVTLDSNLSAADAIDELVRARTNYRGSGTPVFFTTLSFLTDMLLLKDELGRRIYSTRAELASALMVSEIIDVEMMENYPDLIGVMVNLNDYTAGTDRGGEINTFDDFDIDFNQHKYLIETRMSGALIKPKSAVVIAREEGIEVTPTSPSFNADTETILIPTVEGITYSIDGETVTGSQTITKTTQVDAVADPGYYIPNNTTTSWTFVPAGN